MSASSQDRPTLTRNSWNQNLPRLLWVLLILGLLIRLVLAFLPLEQLLLLLEDDAWMVTAIARNFALGRGITADGANPTNGFHPLYPLTLGTIPYLFAPDALDAGLRVNLILCAILSALIGLPLFHLTRRFAGEKGALLAVAVYVLNPYFARVTVNAMDTSLGLLFLLLVAERFYALDRQRWLPAFLFGLLGGLAGLARLDDWILVAFIGLALFWDFVRQRAPFAVVLACALGIALPALPYFAYNYVVFGSLFPSSGRALAYMHSYANGFSLTNILHFIFLNPALNLSFLPSMWLALLIALLLVIAYFWVLPSMVRRALIPLVGYALVQVLYYAYVQQNSNPRYFVGLGAIFCLLLGGLYSRLEPHLRTGALRQGVMAAALVLAVGLNTLEVVEFYRQHTTMPQLTQPTIYEAALWVRDNLSEDALLAAKNSGILQYYSGHVVLNIDGKLNNEIVPVLEQRRLWSYLEEKGVGYLVGRQEAIAGHVALYSQELGDWPVHRELSVAQRLKIYGRLLFSRFGLAAPPELDDASGFEPFASFAEEVQIVQAFPRPNTEVDPVVVYELLRK
jgi:hypothetical protein